MELSSNINAGADKTAIKKGFFRRGKITKRKIIKTIFIVSMLAYSIMHFFVFWAYVSFDSIRLTFLRHIMFDSKGNPVSIYQFTGFNNYKFLFQNIRDQLATQKMLVNSFLYFPVTCFITVPLSLVFSYILYKKMPGAKIFRIIFFLPSILPVAVLTLTYRFAFNPIYGFVNPMLKSVGINNPPVWFGEEPWARISVFGYCIWAGLGFNIILLSGAINRLPADVLEYGQLEGVGMRSEFFRIVIPMIWPTITTLFILAMTSVLTVFMQPLFLTKGLLGTATISYEIYNAVLTNTKLEQHATLGLTMSLIFAPVIMLTRHFLGKLWADVDY